MFVDDDVERARLELESYCHATYGLPLTLVESIQLVVCGPPDSVRTSLRRYIDAGCTHLVVRMGTLTDGDHLDVVADTLVADRHWTTA